MMYDARTGELRCVAQRHAGKLPVTVLDSPAKKHFNSVIRLDCSGKIRRLTHLVGAHIYRFRF